MINLQMDFGFQSLVDSGFYTSVDSGFQSTGFRIPNFKISWILDSAAGRSLLAGNIYVHDTRIKSTQLRVANP